MKSLASGIESWPSDGLIYPEAWGVEEAECLGPYLLNEGDGNHVPGNNAVVHELQEGGQGVCQHLTVAETGAKHTHNTDSELGTQACRQPCRDKVQRKHQ